MIGFIGAGKVGSSLSRFFYEYYVHKGINLLALSSIYSKHVTSANETTRGRCRPTGAVTANKR